MAAKSETRILCVDDEPQVLEGLALHLQRRYDVVSATSGAQGLEVLHKDKSIGVVMSDMRMPGMDGAVFLRATRDVVPDAVRILLTGQTALDSAIAAVNEGQIFRFLTKPCAPAALLAAVDAAVAQHQLLTVERVLLEKTLHGSIKTLTEILSLTNPISFGRATRVKQIVSEVAAELGMQERWQVEVAAMLSQLGCITLPAETVEKAYYCQALSAREQEMVARVPVVTEQLLGNIPRLEVVREILAKYSQPRGPAEGAGAPTVVERGTQILKAVLDFDALEAQGTAASLAIDAMRGRAGRYDSEVLEALNKVRGLKSSAEDVRELPLVGLRVGMVLAQDVKMQSGALLVARGFEVTAGLVERMRNFGPGSVREPIRVVVPRKPVETIV